MDVNYIITFEIYIVFHVSIFSISILIHFYFFYGPKACDLGSQPSFNNKKKLNYSNNNYSTTGLIILIDLNFIECISGLKNGSSLLKRIKTCKASNDKWSWMILNLNSILNYPPRKNLKYLVQNLSKSNSLRHIISVVSIINHFFKITSIFISNKSLYFSFTLIYFSWLKIRVEILILSFGFLPR